MCPTFLGSGQCTLMNLVPEPPNPWNFLCNVSLRSVPKIFTLLCKYLKTWSTLTFKYIVLLTCFYTQRSKQEKFKIHITRRKWIFWCTILLCRVKYPVQCTCIVNVVRTRACTCIVIKVRYFKRIRKVSERYDWIRKKLWEDYSSCRFKIVSGTNSDFLIPISLQPKGLHSQVAKI